MILNNFKNQEREMIFESDQVLLTQEDKNILSTYQRIGVFDSIGDRIQSKREYLESQNEKIINRAQSLEKSINQLDEDISELVKEVNDINVRIVITKEKIDINSESITILKNKINNNTQVLLEYLVYLYKK
jgi:septal ring factor EnvC (AmiA/AmiB activator)